MLPEAVRHVAGRDVQHGRQPSLTGGTQRREAVPAPAMEKVVPSRPHLAGGHMARVAPLGPVVVGSIQEGDEPDGREPQRFDLGIRNFRAAVLVSDRPAQEAAAQGELELFLRLQIKPDAADARARREEQPLRQG